MLRLHVLHLLIWAVLHPGALSAILARYHLQVGISLASPGCPSVWSCCERVGVPRGLGTAPPFLLGVGLWPERRHLAPWSAPHTAHQPTGSGAM